MAGITSVIAYMSKHSQIYEGFNDQRPYPSVQYFIKTVLYLKRIVDDIENVLLCCHIVYGHMQSVHWLLKCWT